MPSERFQMFLKLKKKTRDVTVVKDIKTFKETKEKYWSIIENIPSNAKRFIIIFMFLLTAIYLLLFIDIFLASTITFSLMG